MNNILPNCEKKKLNIWFLSAHDQPRGFSGRTYDFSLQLTKLGHKVTFFTNSFCHWKHTELLEPNEKWRIEYFDNIRVVWLKTIPYSGNGLGRGLNMLSNAYRSIQVSKNLVDDPDIVIGPSVPLGTGWAAMKISNAKNAKFVFEIRDVWPSSLVDDGGLSRWNPTYFCFRWIEKLLYRKASLISSTLPFIHNHVKDSGASPTKVKWLPNGVRMDRFEVETTYNGGNSYNLKIMYIGGYGQAHDVISIIRAAELLKDYDEYNFEFILIGDGVKKAKSIEEVRSLKLENVEFRDSVEKALLPKVQLEADILVASVTESDAYRFGLNLNKLYDYMSSGRPIIFSGSARNDPITESNSGITVKPESPNLIADAIIKLAHMPPQQRAQMGANAIAHVLENYSMETLGKKMEKYLMEIN